MFAQVAETRKRADQEIEASEARLTLSNAKVALSESLADLPEKNEDGEIIYRDAAHERFHKVESDFKAGLKRFSPTIRSRLHASFKEMLTTQQAQVLNKHRDLTILRQRSELVPTLDGLATNAAQAGDPVSRKEQEEFGVGLIANAQKSGILNDVEAQSQIIRFRGAVMAQRKGFFASGLQDKIVELENRAATDEMNATDYAEQAARLIDGAADFLEPGQSAELKSKARVQVWDSALRSRIEKNPAATLAEIKTGKYDDRLTRQSRIQLEGIAGNEVDRLARIAEAQRKEREQQAGKMVSDFRTATELGYEWRGNISQLQAAVNGTEHAGEFQEAVAGAKIKQQFARMSPLEQDAYLQQVRQGPKSGAEAKLLSGLEQIQVKTRAALNQDALGHYTKQYRVELPSLDMADPASLQARSQIAGQAEARYGTAVSPLTDDESRAVIADFNNLRADAKAARMRQMAQSFTPRQQQMIAAQIDKQGAPVLAQAFGMSGEVPEVSSRILQGAEIRKQQPMALPKEASLRSMDEEINKRLAVAYQASPEAMQGAREAIKGYYAWGRWQVNDLSGSLDTGALDRAIYAVTGGLIRHNGQEVLPPRYGANEKQFREMIPRADFAQANFKGDLGKSILDHGKLTSVGRGLYVVRIGAAPVFGKDGRPFLLDLSGVSSR